MPIATVLVVVTAVMASLLEIIDTSIVNVAVPTMMGNLGATLEDISWVITGYIISNAIVLPIAGWLGMRIGRRTYYTGCILLFTASSVACGLAPNLPLLVVFRVFQGMAGGALLPTSQALIQEAFAGPRAGMGSAIYGMSIMIGPTIGPTLGGYLTDNFGWRSIFNINLPLGLIAAALSYFNVKDTPMIDGKKKNVPIDFIGLMLLIIGIGCLQFVLERGEAEDWFSSKIIILGTIAFVTALPTFVWWELRHAHPIVDLRLFKHSAVRYGCMLMAEVGSMLYSLVFFIPVFASVTLGFTATQTGLLFIPGALLAAACMPFIGMQLRKRDPRILILIGIILMSCALFMFTKFNAQTSKESMFLPLLIRGAAMGFLFVPINTVVLGQFSGPMLGQVAGLMNLCRQLGGSVGIALLSTLFTQYRAQYYINVSSKVSLLNPQAYGAFKSAQRVTQNRLSTAIGFSNSTDAAYKSLAFRVQKQVFVLGFDKVMSFGLLLFALSLIPLYLLKPPKTLSGPVDAH